MEEKCVLSPASRRRIFVQTDNGDVLGLELDRRDNAQTVKRRLQLALNVPADESCLTFGDMILKNELDAVPRDSQLRLTRNMIHRSSSTPCLSPTGKSALRRDESGIIQILGQSDCFRRVKVLVKEMLKAIENGVDPIPVTDGLGGAYVFRNCKGQSVAIVKPTDEEPFAPNNPKGLYGKSLGQSGLKRAVRVGETGYREVAAYLLDYDQFAKVPPTALVKISHSIFNVNESVSGRKLLNMGVVDKIASLQQYIPHDFDASEVGTSLFPVDAIHRIGILDIRIFNTDRHAGNILVRKLDTAGTFGQVELIPIDHGLCLPEALEDPYFEWIHWPQASIPFSDVEYQYIMKLDPAHDCEMLRTELPMIREACLRIFVLCTIFLKEATAFGLSLSEIGQMMSRQQKKYEEEPSELESVCLEAKSIIEERREVVRNDSESKDEVFQFDMDYEDSVATDLFSEDHRKCTNGWNPEVELDQSVNEEENLADGERNSTNYSSRLQGNPYLVSAASKKINSFPKSNLKPRPAHVGSAAAGTSFLLRRSAKELNQATTVFVNLADLTENEWVLFLEKFKELLVPAFAERRRSLSISQNLRHRLGTSCQF
ncbi:hypothetical protein M9H77_28875 [Catharanthus roseus]|uniref:Uncharacterized protein n=1 Tax=Catharanthus roseus TaxID=4058 RepID=A0ACC0AI08_CATRO|nr:hypothetical protein M9H77_28875 [Catharanthus roseus]